MMPGIYYMVGGGASGGGGFVVSGTASIDGSAGVMIYLTGGTSLSPRAPRRAPASSRLQLPRPRPASRR